MKQGFRPMRVSLQVICPMLLLLGCDTDRTLQDVETKDISASLEHAISLRDSGMFEAADSAFKAILALRPSSTDSIRVSMSYVPVLIRLNKRELALGHIDRAFPDGGDDLRMLMRRSSFRFQLFIKNRECDSARIELEREFHLVEQDTTLQLTRADIEFNRTFVDSVCAIIPPR